MEKKSNGRKRGRSRNVEFGLPKYLTPAPPIVPTGLLVTANQLRDLWNYDNECGRKYMKGCPLRTCTVDGDLSSEEDSTNIGLTSTELSLIKFSIKDMWQQAGALFEIFNLNDVESGGYRLRVRKDLTIKVVIKKQDAIPWGWIAEIPTALSSAHVFKRSIVDSKGYLGGPVSYMNWCNTSQQRVSVQRGQNAHHICKMWTDQNLSAGVELQWDYDCKLYMPSSGVWFKNECCCVSHVDPSDKRRHEQNEVCRKFVFRELCVLCGFPYSIANNENRIQRKQHFAGVHADFLGSEWDGTGSYEQQVVDPDTLFRKADELNYLVGALTKMNWNVLPACKVFTQQELESYMDDGALMVEFERRRGMFQMGGTLVLRGTDLPFTPNHFKPIQPRPWKVITWKNNSKPPTGRYAVPSYLKDVHETQLPLILSSFCEKYIK